MQPLDVILSGARIADVFRLRQFSGWVGIRDDRFLYVEEGAVPAAAVADERRDLGGSLIVPGLIDAHMHIESSLLTPRRFADAVVPWGTTTVLADPHEVANVAGEAGLAWMINASRGLALDVRIAIPSCVPATSNELEWTGAAFDAGVVDRFSGDPSVAALGEVMDYRRAVDESLPARDELVGMIDLAARRGLLVEGHIPTLRGTELSEYLSLGIGSDHTLTEPSKLAEGLSKGLVVMLQHKSLTKEVIAAVAALPDRSRILLVTDDVEPSLLTSGHLSHIVERAVETGMDPSEALASATVRPARYLGLDRGRGRRGGIAPGYRSDFLVLDELDRFPPREVWIAGQIVAVEGKMVGPGERPEFAPAGQGAPAGRRDFSAREWGGDGTTPLLPGPFRRQDFRLASPTVERGIANAIRIENLINSLTTLSRIRLDLADGFPVWPRDRDLCLVASVARGGAGRSIGVVENLGMRSGAYASSFAHDSHNLLVVGRDPEKMAAAANDLRERRGGIVLLDEGAVAAHVPLPVFGLLSDEPCEVVAGRFDELEHALARLGMKRSRPFLMLSLLALSVSPHYKISDRGIVDTEARSLLAPFEESP